MPSKNPIAAVGSVRNFMNIVKEVNFDEIKERAAQAPRVLVVSRTQAEAERAGAIRAYAKLAESGLRQLRPGGILLACSCSAHVSADEFFGAVRDAARKSGRKFTELRTTRHAPDHHASFPEAEYLKGIYLKL